MKIKKTLVAILIVTIISIGITGISYAIFTATASNNTAISGEASVQNLSLNVTKVVDGGNLIPMKDSLLATAISYTNPCKDKNGYGACHIYKIDVTNDGEDDINVSSTLNFTLTNMENLKWQEIVSQTSIGTITGASNGIEATLATAETLDWRTNDTINKNSTKSYYIAVWISSLTAPQPEGGLYNATVAFKIGTGEIKATFTGK